MKVQRNAKKAVRVSSFQSRRHSGEATSKQGKRLKQESQVHCSIVFDEPHRIKKALNLLRDIVHGKTKARLVWLPGYDMIVWEREDPCLLFLGFRIQPKLSSWLVDPKSPPTVSLQKKRKERNWGGARIQQSTNTRELPKIPKKPIHGNLLHRSWQRRRKVQQRPPPGQVCVPRKVEVDDAFARAESNNKSFCHGFLWQAKSLKAVEDPSAKIATPRK